MVLESDIYNINETDLPTASNTLQAVYKYCMEVWHSVFCQHQPGTIRFREKHLLLCFSDLDCYVLVI